MKTKPKPRCVVCKIEEDTLRPPRTVKLYECPICGQFCCIECMKKHPCK